MNSQCKGLTSDYAEAKEQLLQLQRRYNQKQDAVAQQDMELAQVMKVIDRLDAKHMFSFGKATTCQCNSGAAALQKLCCLAPCKHKSPGGMLQQELEDRKTEVNERGSSISDSTPVVRIKGAIKSIRSEMQQMSVRTGVLQHQLVQVMLAKSQSRLTSE